ncbi:MAG: outer membrane lipoprotein-sorting protein [Acidobacteriota bacterium]|nr:outer membrane lipoprotein-sorting protein [Acidobacteriota bacterium]
MKPAAFLLLTTFVFAFAQTPEEEGLRIARLLDEFNNGFVSEYAELEMTLINAHGDKTVRKMINEAREQKNDGDRSIASFLWPADVKGTRLLTWSRKDGDDDQWLYLPSLKRVKRISSRGKSGAFMGSEFSYEDLGSQEVEEYKHKFLEEKEMDGRKAWVLERIPVSRKSGYSKEIAFFDQEYMQPLRIEYFDRKGELLKIATFTDYKPYGKWFRVGHILMDNVQTRKKSTLVFSKRELGREFDSEHFSSDSLID